MFANFYWTSLGNEDQNDSKCVVNYNLRWFTMISCAPALPTKLCILFEHFAKISHSRAETIPGRGRILCWALSWWSKNNLVLPMTNGVHMPMIGSKLSSIGTSVAPVSLGILRMIVVVLWKWLIIQMHDNHKIRVSSAFSVKLSIMRFWN